MQGLDQTQQGATGQAGDQTRHGLARRLQGALIRKAQQSSEQGADQGGRQGHLPEGDGAGQQHEQQASHEQTDDGAHQRHLASAVKGGADGPGNGGGGGE